MVVFLRSRFLYNIGAFVFLRSATASSKQVVQLAAIVFAYVEEHDRIDDRQAVKQGDQKRPYVSQVDVDWEDSGINQNVEYLERQCGDGEENV